MVRITKQGSFLIRIFKPEFNLQHQTLMSMPFDPDWTHINHLWLHPHSKNLEICIRTHRLKEVLTIPMLSRVVIF
ncbi:hypothetical protein CROQUDRAFT_661655 [Cronartium quercuum f. sp. fusiforme G11]|uniref:Uncharacterized protein n=1 Tax=Cronartium quercuum f. sp. fusiforme G11 TaxID=708437 RepID=A0A9P6NAU7_9BASI|nr:hypothetical protein CROQUDRAFT_661655 [Cronartium quercuum f. sp. fusiforme G11]